jgi:hypothetical protein
MLKADLRTTAEGLIAVTIDDGADSTHFVATIAEVEHAANALRAGCTVAREMLPHLFPTDCPTLELRRGRRR